MRRDPQRDRELVALYKAGVTLRVITAQYRISIQTIYDALARLDERPIRAEVIRHRRAEFVAQSVTLYGEGVPVPELADRLGVRPALVYRALQEAGIPLRPREGKPPVGLPRKPYWELRTRSGAGPYGNPITLGRKFCAECGRWRQAIDFAPQRGTPRARCRVCVRALARDRWRKRTAEEIARSREYGRIWHEAQRRLAGVPPRQWNRQTVIDKLEYVYLPLAPLLAEIERQYPGGVGVGDLAQLAAVPERTIFRLRTGETHRVRLDVADRLAMALSVPLAVLYSEELAA